MIRQSARLFGAAALIALSLPASHAFAQTQVPAAPGDTTAASCAVHACRTVGSRAVRRAYFSPSPIRQTSPRHIPPRTSSSSFLQANWGYDETRIWQVQAIFKTPVEGVSKVIVFVGDKTGKEKPSALEFFTLPDGKHIITGDQIIAFGANPFADDRADDAAARRRPLSRRSRKGLATGRVCRLPVPALQGSAGQHG